MWVGGWVGVPVAISAHLLHALVQLPQIYLPSTILVQELDQALALANGHLPLRRAKRGAFLTKQEQNE